MTLILLLIQAVFAVIIGMYFLNLLRSQQSNKTAVDKESKKELEQLKKLRAIQLSQPLAEKTRPARLKDIIGQQEGVRALKAALCGPNPQHVIIYGPPGVGKTAAARVILEVAKRNSDSPFTHQATFTEVDATTARFDERGIVDPLIGSVHDPIYQGAGSMGVAGIPQPKPGAVTKAHGGILFLDEIGELHPVQMNKLLKVLEDRKVFLESSYYHAEDRNIPRYIHDIFQNGLPADFRLVGATTRSPEELPPALRSRCMEIYFRPLLPAEIQQITENAIEKLGFEVDAGAVDVAKRYASNGREAVNMIQLAGGLALTERRDALTAADVEWVAQSSRLSPRHDKKIHKEPTIGLVNGLAVYGPNLGSLLEIEVSTIPISTGKGSFTITGVVDEEELGGGNKTLRRKSMAKSSIENVLTVLRRVGINTESYDIHVNFPGGIPMDGPSAGTAIATAISSSILNITVDHKLAMTGEIGIHGKVKPVGGVVAKVEAALHAGVKRVLIPVDNWQDLFHQMDGIEIISVETIEEVLRLALGVETVYDEHQYEATVASNNSSIRPAYPLMHADGREREV